MNEITAKVRMLSQSSGMGSYGFRDVRIARIATSMPKMEQITIENPLF